MTVDTKHNNRYNVYIQLVIQEVSKLSLSKLDVEAAKTFLKMARNEIKRKNYRIQRCKYYNGVKYRTADLLLDIGIMNEKEVWDYILDLSEDDLIDVSPDHDKRWDCNTEQFEFIKKINGKDVYIKLTIRDKLICLSFHENNYASIGGKKNE